MVLLSNSSRMLGIVYSLKIKAYSGIIIMIYDYPGHTPTRFDVTHSLQRSFLAGRQLCRLSGS